MAGDNVTVTKTGSAQADAEKIKALASVLNTSIDNVGGVIKELLRTSAAQPIIAAVTMIIIADLLKSKGVISETAFTDISEFIAALTAAEVLSDLFKSSVTTLAYGAEAATSSAALLGLLA